MQKLGEYEIRAEIGRGGFGRVYQGFDHRVGRLVAIKVLDEQADASLVARFRNEAAAAGNLRHKNIVTVYGYGEDQGHHFLVMEYLDGRDLQNLIQEKHPLTLLQKVDIMAQVAEGLHCAHMNGVLHRDVKPANIKVLSDGTAKIMDFGIARLLREGASRVTQADQLVGTVAYMAPEQFTQGAVDVLGDIWAYGVILYELLVGTNPFTAPEPGVVMYRVTTVNPEPVRTFYPECPLALERIVERLLAKDRDYRYSSFDDVQYDLVPVLKELQHDFARALLAKATGLVREKRLDEANALARRIFDLDPSNVEAGELRTMIQEETKQRKVRPRVAALLKQAETEAERRNFPAALRSLEHAQRLAPNDSEVMRYKEQIQAATDQIALAERLTRQGKRQLEVEDLTGALRTITAALAADSTNAEALRILSDIRASMEVIERKRKLQNELNRAEMFLSIGAFPEAADLVDRLKRDHPESTEILTLSVRLQTHQLDKFKHDELASAGALLSAGSFAEAASKLENLSAQFPDAADVQHLLSVARQQMAASARARFCAEVENSVRDSLRNQDFTQALLLLDRASQSHPDEPLFASLKSTVLDQKAVAERDFKIQTGLLRAEELERQGELNLALGGVESLSRELGASEELEACARRLRAAFDEKERSIRNALQAAREFLETAQPGPAVTLLREALENIGEDARLRHFLDRAVIFQQDAERAREREAANAHVLELERLEDWGACQAAIEEARLRFGSSEILDSASGRVSAKLDLTRWQELIRQNIQDQDWEAGTANCEAARSHFPNDAAWQDLFTEIRTGQLREQIEGALRAENLDTVSNHLAEARRLPSIPVWIEVFQARLDRAAGIRARLERASAAHTLGDYALAQQLLREILDLEPSHKEAQTLLAAARMEQEKRAALERKHESLKRAASFLFEERFSNAIETLENALLDAPGDPDLHAQLERVRAAQTATDRRQVISDICESASAEIQEGKLDAAAGRLAQALRLYGQEEKLIEILRQANGLQQEQQRASDITARISSAAAYQKKDDWESASHVLEEGLHLYGPLPEFEQAASEARSRVKIQRLQRGIEQLIKAGSWAAAQKEIDNARQEVPQDPAWDAYASQVRLGFLKTGIDAHFAAGELQEVRRLLTGAGESFSGEPWLDPLLRALERAERRRDVLEEVRLLEARQQFAEAEKGLLDLAANGFNDAEIAATFKRLERRRQEEDRISRRSVARTEALRLVEERKLPSALSAVQELLQEFPGDQELLNDQARIQAEMRQLAVRQAAAQREVEERRRKILDQLVALETGRQFDEAEKLLRDFLAQFEDAAILSEQQRLGDARNAWERALRRDSARAAALSLITELRLDAAAEALATLVQEFPGDQELRSDLDRVQAQAKQQEEERRSDVLRRAREMGVGKRFAEADQLLQEFQAKGFDHPEIQALRKELARERQADEIAARRAAARAEVQRLMGEQSFEAASMILRKLQKEFPKDQELKEDGERLQAEVKRLKQERLEKERTELYARSNALAVALVKQGKLDEAIGTYRSLLEQFPRDRAIESEISGLEAKREIEAKRWSLAERRKQALDAVRSRDFDLASKLLPPLLKEQPQSNELKEAWRLVAAEKRNSHWLDIYEETQELEELFRKGKALKVKQRAEKLLEQAEDPKVRGYLTWAEGVLAKEPPKGGHDLETIKNKIKKWRPFSDS